MAGQAAPANPCAANPCAANPCAANPCAANPCAANPCAANPCAANPCAANPCAANPCAANPCAANPCAANPCAGGAAVEVSDDEAKAAYDSISAKIRAGYAASGLPVAAQYYNWKRYNRVPYVSETHGARHVNNFANDVAKAYGRFEKAGVMPVGSVLAKDSFKLTAAQPCAAPTKAQPGPLFIMEKMEAGFNAASDDWRYTMVMPDGSIYGITKGKGSAKMDFCAECHMGADVDSMFFMPEEYR